MRRLLTLLAVAGLAATVASPAREADRGSTETPRKSGLIERTGARLIQIDVTLTGPEAVLEELTAGDFRVKVGGQNLTDFEVDRVCRDPSDSASLGRAAAPAGDIAGTAGPAPAPALAPTTFLIYFDQPHLTMAGRQESLDLVREMVPQLVTGGNRAMVVSNADRLETVVALTDDADEVVDGLSRLERDRSQWDLYAEQETSRVEEILGYLGMGSNSITAGSRSDFQRAQTLAKQYYQDELWRAERDLRRFAMVLARLSEAKPPKVVLYLADTMRSNAGEHYLDLFGEFARREMLDQTEPQDWRAAFGPELGAILPFDRVVEMASAHGARLYTIQAQGMITATRGAPTTQRARHAQNTLADLALETGGRAFLNGVRAGKIVEAIQQDLSCLYLVSFRPEGLPEDRGLRVVVDVDRPRVRTQVRGRLVIQSETAALTSRLLAAFSDPVDPGAAGVPVRPSIIPMGWADGTFSALVQVAVPGSGFPGSTWDLGASVISRGRVRETSGRLTVSAANAPVVLQEQMTFAPGPFEIVAVAHDTTSDVVASQHLDGSWPRPNAELADIGPVAVLQPTAAAIRLDDEIRTAGYVAYAEEEPVRIDRKTLLLAVVCKSGDARDGLVVERSLVGTTAVDFEPHRLDLDDAGCALVQDVVPAGTMTSGTFHYLVRVVDGDQPLIVRDRRFFAWDGKALDASGAASPTEPGGA